MMLRYATLRLALLVPVLVAASLIVFVLGRLAPGDPVALILAEHQSHPEVVDRIRAEFGLDRPVAVQYLYWLRQAATGDLGISLFRFGRPVTAIIAEGLATTVTLAATALAVAVVGGVGLGVCGAVWRGTWIDGVSLTVALLGACVPRFVLGPLGILLFALTLHVLPVAGWGRWRHYVLPAAVLSAQGLATLCRLTRSSLAETLGRDYVRTARAKGCSEWGVVLRHGLRNALVPVVTLIGTTFGFLLSGSFIVETIFNVPGIGRLGVTAIFQRDYPVIQGVTLVMVLLFMLINLAVDLSYSWLNPRVRHD
jgi:ABC-type dipeptide/oligopeptide/nickel transport system permease component